MKCAYCGSENDEGAKRCKHCHKKLGANGSDTNDDHESLGKPPLVAIIAVAASVLVAMTAFIIHGRMNANDVETEPVNKTVSVEQAEARQAPAGTTVTSQSSSDSSQGAAQPSNTEQVTPQPSEPQQAPSDKTNAPPSNATTSVQNSNHPTDETDASIDDEGDNQHSYQLFDEGITWSEAERRCEEMGGHLVTIESEEEQRYLEDMLSGSASAMYWIGLRYDGSGWLWVTGEGLSYEKWAPGEPNDDWNGTEHLAEIYGDMRGNSNWQFSIGEWNNSRDDGGNSYWSLDYKGFICEWE